MSYIKYFHSGRYVLLSASVLALSTAVAANGTSTHHRAKSEAHHRHHQAHKAAEPCCKVETCNSGSFYVGVGLDRANGNYTDYSSGSIFDLDGVTGFTSTNYANGGGGSTVYGTFLAGYESKPYCRFNWAVEASISLTPMSDGAYNTSSFNATVLDFGLVQELAASVDNFNLNCFLGLSILPGYQVQPDFTAYGRFGIGTVRASWEQRATDDFFVGTAGSTGGTALLGTYDKVTDEWLNAFILGVGFNVRTSEHISVGLGYTWYNMDSLDLNFETFDPDAGSETFNANRNPQLEVATASFIYYFTPTEHYCAGPVVRPGSEFYLGAYGVRDNTYLSSISHDANPNRDNPGDNHNEFYEPSTSVLRGWGGEVVGGYGYTLCGGAYIGVEGFFNYAPTVERDGAQEVIPGGVSAGAADSTINTTGELEMNEMYGAAAITGFKLNNNTMLYAKLGFAGREFDWKSTYVTSNTRDLRSLALDNFDYDNTFWGYQIGAGVETRICDCVFLRSEYVVTWFGEWERDRRTTPFLSASGAGFLSSIDNAFTPLTSQFKVGVVYKFEV